MTVDGKGVCACNLGWGKAKDADENACSASVCVPGCGAHGDCVEGKCSCQPGWTGPLCRKPQCANDCSGNGVCQFVSPHSPAQCKCDFGWGGEKCERDTYAKSLPKCPNDCSGNGICLAGKCMCTEMNEGPDCSYTVCPDGMSGPGCKFKSCPNDCSGNGLCQDGECICAASHTAKDCSIPVPCFEPCQAVCGQDPDLFPDGKAQCASCVGDCETMKGTAGFHSPFKDIMQ